MKRAAQLACTAAALVALLCVAVTAQHRPPAPLPAGPVVSSWISVQDGRGQPFLELTAKDVGVTDTNLPTRVVQVDPAPDFPLRLGILLDTTDAELLSQARPRLDEVLHQVVRGPEDRVFMMPLGRPGISFARSWFNARRTGDIASLWASWSEGKNEKQGEQIVAALRAYVDEVNKLKTPGRRVVVIVNGSGLFLGRYVEPKVTEYVLREGITLHSINFYRSFYNIVGPFELPYFRDVAEASGGMVVDDIPPLAGVINGQYRVTWEPEGFKPNDKFRATKVRIISGKNLRLQHPKGYYAH
jgi:hypothetical protein